MTQAGSALKLATYQAQAVKTDYGPHGSLAFPILGLFGETGSLLSVVKKKQRDKAAYLGYTPHVVEELGDVLWYLTIVAKRAGVSLTDVGNNTRHDFSDWVVGGGRQLTFRDLQNKPHRVASKPSLKFENTLLGLASEIGTLVTDFQTGKLASNQDALRGRLVATMRILIKAADEAGVTLEHAAENNLQKIFDRWPEKRRYPPPFDSKALRGERLPRKLTIDMFERKVGGKLYVFQQCNGLNIGDRLTDNALEPDDYRFHDVFHYAYCAVLTWSPVVRSLLRLKRKSDPLMDEAEDGARATLIEEGIASWLFGQAKALKFFEGMRPGELSFDALKTVRQFVAGYEPERCPLWLWEDAILQGFNAFRFLQSKRKARLRIDMERRRLLVGALTYDS